MKGKRARRGLYEHLVDLLPLIAAVILILFLLFWAG